MEPVSAGHWSLPHPRSPQALQLHTLLCSVPAPSPSSGQDLWKQPSGSYTNKFSTSGTWAQIRTIPPKVPWCKIVFRESVPKYLFIQWMAFKDRLPTRDRLISWGFNFLAEIS
ncbi:hypothetical protein V5N11_000961 [Cardamine amara subsp. amara]|uniref:Reverse transcriptase zinc-binding domain-containing protein n=1 Tax=Cardamine amara subsp. amara TaxID=228776 RepID=A0ABD1C5B6_CARAN